MTSQDALNLSDVTGFTEPSTYLGGAYLGREKLLTAQHKSICQYQPASPVGGTPSDTLGPPG